MTSKSIYPATMRHALLTIGLVVCFCIVAPMFDSVAKYLTTQGIHPMVVSFSRFLFGSLVLIPLCLYNHGYDALLRPNQPGWQAIRAVLLVIATITFFNAIARIPLADALALAFVHPLFVTILSPIFLKEKVGWRRYASVLVGSLGMVLIIRPGGDNHGWVMLLPITAGLSYSCYAMLTRYFTYSAPNLVTMSWTAGCGAVILTPFAIYYFDWAVVEPYIGMLLLLGLLANMAHYFLIKAHEYAGAAWIAPWMYLEIVAATLLGWFVFGDFPHNLTWLGIALIVTSGIYISFRERIKRSV